MMLNAGYLMICFLSISGLLPVFPTHVTDQSAKGYESATFRTTFRCSATEQCLWLTLTYEPIGLSGLSSCLPIEQGREDRSQFEISDMFNIMDSGDNTVSRSHDFYFLEHLLFKWLCSNHYRVSDTPYCNSNPTLSALRANRIANDDDRADRRGWRENMLHKLMN